MVKRKSVYDLTKEFDLDVIADTWQRSYIENRIIAQIKWYDDKAIKSQKYYKRFVITSSILSAGISDFNSLNCGMSLSGYVESLLSK